MTMHRVRLGEGYGWAIRAGCCRFVAPSIDEVCAAVRANVASNPTEWCTATAQERERWATQVDAALSYLAAMCGDDEPEDHDD